MRLTLEQEDENLQSVFQKEIVSFKELSKKQQLIHIWNYHKWKILLPLLLIFMGIGSLLLFRNQKENYLFISFMNSTMDLTSYGDLQKDFADYAELDPDAYDISMESLTADVSTRVQIATKFFSENIDVVLCDRETFSLYYENGCFTPLEDYIPADYYEKYPFEPLTYYDQENKTEHIYGIVLKDNSLLRKYYVDPPVFAVSLKAHHKEAAGQYLQYLLEMQNDYTH